MPRSLGDGIRAVNEAVERDHARARDLIETMRLREDHEARGIFVLAAALVIAAEAVGESRLMADRGSNLSPVGRMRRRFANLMHFSEEEIDRYTPQEKTDAA